MRTREQRRLVRTFIVGCPRSGTTLLQAMLGAHPDVFTLPETHYFKKIFGRAWRARWLGVVSPRAARLTLRRVLDEAGAHDDGTQPLVPLARVYAGRFVAALDAAALAAGKQGWVEKSPIHLHCVNAIARYVPEARFVHILRDGAATVRSFYQLCLDQPDRWIGQVLPGSWRGHLDHEPHDHRILRAVVDRWNGDVRRSLSVRGPHHYLVLYERLVTDPEPVLRQVCDHIGLAYAPAMLRHDQVAEQVVGWRVAFAHMRGVLGPLERDRAATARPLGTLEEAILQQHLWRSGRPWASDAGQTG